MTTTTTTPPTFSTVSIGEMTNNQMSSYECKETVNLPALDTIISNYEDIIKTTTIRMVDKNNNYKEIPQDQILTLLKKYRTNRRQGKKINYKFARGRNKGRLFAQSTSGQGLPRPVRHTIFNEYIDIDIVNCHPVLLCFYCKERGWKYDSIRDYVIGRDAVLEQVMKHFSIDRERSKNIFLVAMNGGSVDEFRELGFVDDFVVECKMIHIRCLEQATDEERIEIQKYKQYNIGGSLLNHILCSMENFVLSKIIQFYECKGFKNIVPCFDGLLVGKDAVGLTDELQVYLDNLNIENLKVKQKQMDEALELEPYKENVIELDLNPLYDIDDTYNCSNFFTDLVGKSFGSIEQFKDEVVRNYARVFIHFKEHKHFFYRSGDGLIKMDSENFNTKPLTWKVEGKIIRFSNIEEMFPNNIVFYRSFMFAPGGRDVYGETCSTDVFNTWAGFQARPVEDINYDLIRPILNHILTCWSTDDEVIYNYILDWIAHIIQKPYEKTKVLILLYSKEQQIGKNIIIEFLINFVLGRDLSLATIGTNSLTTRFNGDTQKKILFNCNELPAIDGSRNAQFDTLKSLITESSRDFEIKNGPKWSGPNYCNVIATTNHNFTYHTEEGDGRTFAVEVSCRYKRNFEYFKELNKVLNQEGADHFLTFLLQREITNDLRNIPETNLKKDMMVQSLPTPLRFLNYLKENPECLDTGMIFEVRAPIDPDDKYKIQAMELYTRYNDWCKTCGEKVQSMSAFGRIVKEKIEFKRTNKGGYYYIKDYIEK